MGPWPRTRGVALNPEVTPSSVVHLVPFLYFYKFRYPETRLTTLGISNLLGRSPQWWDGIFCNSSKVNHFAPMDIGGAERGWGKEEKSLFSVQSLGGRPRMTFFLPSADRSPDRSSVQPMGRYYCHYIFGPISKRNGNCAVFWAARQRRRCFMHLFKQERVAYLIGILGDVLLAHSNSTQLVVKF